MELQQSMETTTIEISVENWQWLQAKKQRPSETFNDVVDRLRHDRLDQSTETQSRSEPTQPDGSDEINEVEDDHNQIGLASVPEDIDLPGSGEVFERRRQAIGKLYTFLRREGTATRSDFLQLVDPDDVSYNNEGSFWSNAVKGRDSLSSLPGVESPGEGEHKWRYTGK
jgi:hypothetical protein